MGSKKASQGLTLELLFRAVDREGKGVVNTEDMKIFLNNLSPPLMSAESKLR